MAFKIGKIAQARVIVKASIPDGENMREEKMTVGMNIFATKEQVAMRQALLDKGSKDVDLDFLKDHGITSIEGPQFEDGAALTIEEALDVPYLRIAIERDYNLTMGGMKRKN